MRRREEKRVEKEWRYQKMREQRRVVNRQRAIKERKCFGCGGFGHIVYNYRNVGAEEPTLVSSNKFEVLKVRVMQREEGSSKEIAKDRREILREERVKRGVEVGKMKKGKKAGHSCSSKHKITQSKKNIERSDSKDWVEIGRKRKRSCNRSTVR